MSICNEEKSKNITVYLHKECTLKCPFCFQNHNKFLKNITNLDFNKIYDSIHQAAISKDLNINFTGGELFYSDKVIDDLVILIDKLRQEYNLHIVPSSNLICNMSLCYRFIDYLYKYDLIKSFSTSFDFKERFKHDRIAELWYKNLIELQSKYPRLQIIVNTIITNELIDSFNDSAASIEKDIFKKVYDKFTIALQLLSVYDKKDYISDDDFKKIHDYFLKFFPNITFLYTGYGKQCCYNNTYIIYGNGKAVKGCYENNYGESVDLDEIKKLYIKKNKCILCKRYGYCQHECYMEWYHKYRNNLDNTKCYYKIVGEV